MNNNVANGVYLILPSSAKNTQIPAELRPNYGQRDLEEFQEVTANGVATSFNVTINIANANQLILMESIGGEEYALYNPTHYTTSGNSVVFPSAPEAGRVFRCYKYITTTFGQLVTDPELKVPSGKIGDDDYALKLSKGGNLMLLAVRVQTIQQTNPDVDIVFWQEARRRKLLYEASLQ